jgi:hypothetical protein
MYPDLKLTYSYITQQLIPPRHQSESKPAAVGSPRRVQNCTERSSHIRFKMRRDRREQSLNGPRPIFTLGRRCSVDPENLTPNPQRDEPYEQDLTLQQHPPEYFAQPSRPPEAQTKPVGRCEPCLLRLAADRAKILSQKLKICFTLQQQKESSTRDCIPDTQ